MRRSRHSTEAQRAPELEGRHARQPALGYEAPEEIGAISCLAHGYPTPLARWHCHNEYELHLIVATSGKAFVGDWIGPFEPGHLVLCGPGLPHNWVSHDLPDSGVALRDLVIQFPHEPIARAAEFLPELAEVMQLLDRARQGVEFFGLGERAHAQWHRVKHAGGIRRFAAFCDLLADLARSSDYRVLSTVHIQGEHGSPEIDCIHSIVDQIAVDLDQHLPAGEFAARLGMSESRFSRMFRRATGNTFTDFVNRIRVNRACQLLVQTDRQVTDICYEVGFNNVANFNRRFRAIKAMTPSQYRHHAQGRFGRGG